MESTAFTIDFGGGGGPFSRRGRKKLSLSDGIKRFAPNRRKKMNGTSLDTANSLSPTLAMAETSSSSSISLSSKGLVLMTEDVGCELNETFHQDHFYDAVDKDAVGGAVSETGTYVIDEEEDDDIKEDIHAARNNIDTVFGVDRNSESNQSLTNGNNNYVAAWTIDNFILQQQKEEQQEQQPTHKMPTSFMLSDDETSALVKEARLVSSASSSRRKSSVVGHTRVSRTQSTTRVKETVKSVEIKHNNAYAPISVRPQQTIISTKSPLAKAAANRSYSASTTKNSLMRVSSANTAKKKQKEENMAAWLRRKSYDPMKASLNVSGGGKSKIHSAKIFGPTSQHLETDESGNETQRSLPARLSLGSYTKSSSLTGAKNNRYSLETSCSRPFARTDLIGRSSLRQSPVHTRSRSVRNHDRSSSSLSCKQSEFVSWKRRNEYHSGGGVSSVISVPSSRCSILSNYDSSIRAVVDAEDQAEALSLVQITDDEYFLPIQLNKTGPNDSSSAWMLNGSSSKNRRSSHMSSSSSPSAGRVGDISSNLKNLVPATLLSVSSKLCLKSSQMLKKAHELIRNRDREEGYEVESDDDRVLYSMVETLIYILEDVECQPSVCDAKSWELSAALRNLKKLEQALEAFERLCLSDPNDTETILLENGRRPEHDEDDD